MGLGAANLVSNGVSLNYAWESEDSNAIALATISIFPPASIAGSVGSILYDLSDAVYFVPSPMQGPPTGPYCDGIYNH